MRFPWIFNKNRLQDSDIEELVRELLEDDEVILIWNKDHNNELMVMLIISHHLPIHKEFRRGGAGHMLRFKNQEEKWILVSKNLWIS